MDVTWKQAGKYFSATLEIVQMIIDTGKSIIFITKDNLSQIKHINFFV